MTITALEIATFSELHTKLELAAEELFKAYTQALPDKQDWLGRYGWHGNTGTITFVVKHQVINYEYEYYSHGETDYFNLQLPFSALYDPTFIERAQSEWEYEKAAQRLVIQLAAETQAERRERDERILYQTLKAKYDKEPTTKGK